MNMSVAAVLNMVPHTIYLNLVVILEKKIYFYKSVSRLSSSLQGSIYA